MEDEFYDYDEHPEPYYGEDYNLWEEEQVAQDIALGEGRDFEDEEFEEWLDLMDEYEPVPEDEDEGDWR